MAGEKSTLRDYWQEITRNHPESTPEHIKITLEAMFYSGVVAHENLLKRASHVGDMDVLRNNLKAIEVEIRSALADLETRKQQCSDAMKREQDKEKH